MQRIIFVLLATLTVAGIQQGINQIFIPSVVVPAPTSTPISTAIDTPIPTAAATLAPESTVTPTLTPTLTATAPAGGPCSCSGNLYNCSDFDTHSQAQACYNYCISQGAGDVHHLDSNSDGDACESLPGNFRILR